MLGWLGVKPAEDVYVLLARIFSVVYFAFFLLMPYYTHYRQDQAGAGQGRPIMDKATRILRRVICAVAAVWQRCLVSRRTRARARRTTIRAASPSLQRGARNFMNYCSGCHSAKYVRYNTIGRDLELSDDQLLENLMFNAEKTFETIQANMPQA